MIRFSLSGFGDEISADLDAQLDALKALRISALDLRTAFGKNVLALTNAEVDEIGARVRGHGMRVQSIGSPVNKVKFTPEGRSDELSRLHRASEIAKRLGTQRIRVFTPETDPNGGQEAWPEIKIWMAPQVRYAHDNSLVLLHENDGRFFGAFPGNARLLFHEFGGPHFKAVYDPGNAVLIGTRTMRDWFPWIQIHLDTIHVKDGKQAENRFVNPGTGDGELKEMFSFLVMNGWHGQLTMEPHAQIAGENGGFSGEEAFRTAVAALRGVLDAAGAEA